jgi:restriction system protein
MSKERTVWGFHMGALHGTAPLTSGYITMGWPEVGDVSQIPASREAFKTAYAKAIPDSKPGTIPVSAGQIYRFVHEMKIGDIIVYPSKHDRMINIGEISGPYAYDPAASTEYPRRRPVNWLRNVSREEFSQSALYEAGSALTLFKITSHADEFLSALDGQPVPKAEKEDSSTAIAIAEQFEESTEDFIIKRLKSAQTAYEFEHFVAHLLQCMGYHSRVTKASGDGGVDVIAHRDELGFEAPIIKVQCKQTLGNSGRPDVQKLFGAIERDEKGLFVTLGTFSPDARVFEQSKSNLRLIDGRGLIELIYNHYHKFSPRYQALVPLKRTYSAAA